jgi:hypothetical protein
MTNAQCSVIAIRYMYLSDEQLSSQLKKMRTKMLSPSLAAINWEEYTSRIFYVPTVRTVFLN